MGKVRRFATRTLPQPLALVFDDESGKRVTEEFTLRYRSYSQRALDEIERIEKERGGDSALVPFSAYLSYMVVAVTDNDRQPLTGDTGEPVVFYSGDDETLKSAREFFDLADIQDNTKKIWEAIQADINPQKASSVPGPSGSEPAASEA